MSDVIIADLVLSYLGRGNVTLKGDSPGHPFRGNQYDEGGGGGSGDSGGSESGGGSSSESVDYSPLPTKKTSIKIGDQEIKGDQIGVMVAHKRTDGGGFSITHAESGTTLAHAGSKDHAVQVMSALHREGFNFSGKTAKDLVDAGATKKLSQTLLKLTHNGWDVMELHGRKRSATPIGKAPVFSVPSSSGIKNPFPTGG